MGKLQLRKETLKILNGPSTSQAVGGTNPITLLTFFYCSKQESCNAKSRCVNCPVPDPPKTIVVSRNYCP
jgi:hypothetical protein